MSILFVTSFTQSMYASTGRDLLDSFAASGSDGHFLVCHEGFGPSDLFTERPLLSFDLDKSDVLRHWIESNLDIIPVELGGEAKPCNCPVPDDPYQAHRSRCPWGWFNKNSSRWFRKIVALERAAEISGYNYLIWLDCDCVFTQKVTEAAVTEWFGSKFMFYLKSPQRITIESGVMGFSWPSGVTIIHSTLEHYVSGKFRMDPRWDDGYQIQLSVRRHPEIDCVDLATHASGKWPFGDVVENSPIGKYIEHRKGIHRGRWTRPVSSDAK